MEFALSSVVNFSSLPQFHSISLKLDHSNYMFWRALVLPTIRAHGFDYLISGLVLTPSPFRPSSAGGVRLNPDYSLWIRRDQHLLSWMLNCIGESMLAHVVRCTSARALWIVLETLFHATSKARYMQLRTCLCTMKKGNMSVDEYFMKMRSFSDQLAAIGKPIPEDELVGYILNGFGSEYEVLIVNMMQRVDDFRIDEVHSVFQAYEIRLQQHISPLQHSANISYRGVCDSYGGFVDGGYVFTKSCRRAAGFVVCQICNRTGHKASKCFKRFNIHFHGVGSLDVFPQAFVVSEHVSTRVSIFCDSCKVGKLQQTCRLPQSDLPPLLPFPDIATQTSSVVPRSKDNVVLPCKSSSDKVVLADVGWVKAVQTECAALMDKSPYGISSDKIGLVDNGWFQAVQAEFHTLVNKSIAMGCISTHDNVTDDFRATQQLEILDHG